VSADLNTEGRHSAPQLRSGTPSSGPHKGTSGHLEDNPETQGELQVLFCSTAKFSDGNLKKPVKEGQAWWCTPVIPALRNQKWEKLKFQVSLGYPGRSRHKTKQTNEKTKTTK
jgi:hypothetical protein